MSEPTPEQEQYPYYNHDSDIWSIRFRAICAAGIGVGAIFWGASNIPEQNGDQFWNVFIIGSVTWLILVTAWVQIDVNRRQWQAMQDGLKQTREMFELTERPSLGLDFPITVWPRDERDLTKGFDVKVVIRNFGRSPAVKGDALLVIGFPLSAEIPSNACPEPLRVDGDGGRSRLVIPAGGNAILRGDLTEDEFTEIQQGTRTLLVWVSLEYWGVNGREAPYTFEYYGRLDIKTGYYEVCQNHNEAT